MSLGGVFYPVGQAISTLVGEHAEGLTMVPVLAQGSVQNPRLINSGEVEIAITNNNLSAFGAGDFFFKLANRVTHGIRAAGAKTAVILARFWA